MKINIYYEKKNIEFSGKLYLSIKLINLKEVKEVNLGFYKPLILKFLSELDNKKNVLNLYKDYWKNTEIFFDLANLFGQKYYINHEEDYLVFHKEIIKKAAKMRFMSKFYFQNVDGIFCLSNEIKNEYIKSLKLLSKKYEITGDLRYSFLKLVKTKGHFQGNIKKKFTLISLHSEIFRSRFRYMKRTKFDPKNLKNKQFTGYSNLDEQLLYDYTKDYLRLAIKVIKDNPNIKFLIRPYPSENEFLRYYKMIFKKYKNVTIDINNDIFYCLKNSNQTFCPPDNVSLESLMMGNFTYTYYDQTNLIHKYIFKDHPFVKMFKKNFFKNKKELGQILLNKKKYLDNTNQKTIYKMYGLDNNAFELIPNIFKNSLKNSTRKKNYLIKLKKFFVSYAIKKILRVIKDDIKKENYSSHSYHKFKKKFKFSLSRAIMFFVFSKTSSRLDLINIIYKYCIGRNFIDHSVLENRGDLYNMNMKEIKDFLKFYKIKFSKNIKIKLNKKNNILTLYKVNQLQ